jgi:hypothetical protein
MDSSVSKLLMFRLFIWIGANIGLALSVIPDDDGALSMFAEGLSKI